MPPFCMVSRVVDRGKMQRDLRGAAPSLHFDTSPNAPGMSGKCPSWVVGTCQRLRSKGRRKCRDRSNSTATSVMMQPARMRTSCWGRWAVGLGLTTPERLRSATSHPRELGDETCTRGRRFRQGRRDISRHVESVDAVETVVTKEIVEDCRPEGIMMLIRSGRDKTIQASNWGCDAKDSNFQSAFGSPRARPATLPQLCGSETESRLGGWSSDCPFQMICASG